MAVGTRRSDLPPTGSGARPGPPTGRPRCGCTGRRRRGRRGLGAGCCWALEHAAALIGADDDPRTRWSLAPVGGRSGPEIARAAPCRAQPGLRGAPARHLRAEGDRRRGSCSLSRHRGGASENPHRDRAAETATGSLGPGGLPYFAFHRFGLERRRADVIRAAAQFAPRLETATPGEADTGWRAVPGDRSVDARRGWCVVAFGDPDALSVGDFHLPNLVAWALRGEPTRG